MTKAIEDIADNYTQSQMIGLGTAFIICPILAVGLRIWAKFLGRRGIAWDDYLIMGALVGTILRRKSRHGWTNSFR